MTLETLYFIAQIVAALAIVGSLVFVGLQVRAQTQEQAVLRAQERANVAAHLNGIMASSADARRVFAKAALTLDELETEEFSLYSAIVRQSLLAQQLYFRQMGPGQQNKNWQGTFSVAARFYLTPGFQQFWAHFRNDYPEDFAAYIDELIVWGKDELKPYPGQEDAYLAGGGRDDA